MFKNVNPERSHLLSFPPLLPPTSSVSTCSMCTTCRRAATARARATACAASRTTAGARCWASPWPPAPPPSASARRKRRSAPASAWRTRTCSAGASPSPSQLRPLRRGTTRPHHPPHLRLHLRFQFNLFPPPLFPSFPWRSRAPLGGKGVRGVSVRERGNPRSPSPFRCLRGPTAPGGGAGGDLTPFPPKPEPFLRSAASCHPACRLSSPNLVHVLHSACANLWLLNYSHASSHASCSLMPGLFLCFVQHFM